MDRLRSERAQWAYSHGLEPLDGVYLAELRRRPLTFDQLAEALAIVGQSADMVADAVGRLQKLGFVELVDIDADSGGPAPEAIAQELEAALEDLQAVLAEVETEEPFDRRTAGLVLRRAMNRVVVARRYTASIGADDQD